MGVEALFSLKTLTSSYFCNKNIYSAYKSELPGASDSFELYIRLFFQTECIDIISYISLNCML